MKRSILPFLLAVLLLINQWDAGAQCDPPEVDPVNPDITIGAAPITTGVLHPINGFPVTVHDTNDVVLELCLDGANCEFSPLVVGSPFSEKIGFGQEAFWWSAEATIPVEVPVGEEPIALVVMAVEAGFNPPVVADGNQAPFTRLRLRITPPEAGYYTVTHPFGQIIDRFLPAERRAVNETFDIPFGPDEVHQGRVGPFLVWDPLDEAPEGFVGDPFVPHAVTGSPCGTNEFRISAVEDLVNRTPIDLNGAEPGNDLVTDLFFVQGKLFALAPVGPADGQVTFNRDAQGAGSVDFLIPRSPGAVTAQAVGVETPLPGEPVLLPLVNGIFTGSEAITAGDILPNNVAVTFNLDVPGEMTQNFPLTVIPVGNLAKVTATRNSSGIGTLDFLIPQSPGAVTAQAVGVETPLPDEPIALTAANGEFTASEPLTAADILPDNVAVTFNPGGEGELTEIFPLIEIKSSLLLMIPKITTREE